MSSRETDPVARLYRATRNPQLVRVPRLRFLCLDGQGDPDTTPAYAAAVQSLYAVAYGARFMMRRTGSEDAKVSKLEGLWWSDDMTVFTRGDRYGWRWTMMIRQPEAVSADLVQRLAGEVATTKSLPTALGLRLVDLEEGDAAQVLHVGPYADEAPTIACLHGFLREQRLSLRGRHHGDLPQRPASVSARQAPHHHPAAVRPWLSLRGPVHWPC